MGLQGLLDVTRGTPWQPNVVQKYTPPSEWSDPVRNMLSSSSASLGSSTPYAPMPIQAQGSVGLPFSSDTGYKSGVLDNTQGNPIGSLSGSLNDLQNHANLGNIVPYTMERPAAAIDKFAESIIGSSDKGFLGTGMNLNPLDALLGGVKAASDIAGPALSFAPNLARDANLNVRVDQYRKVAQALAQMNAAGVDTNTFEKQLPAGLVDLPQELKDALDKNPNLSQADVDKLFDQYGRQSTYIKGVAGMAMNLASMGVLYAPEMLLGGAALGAVRGAGAALEAGSTAARVYGAVSKTASVAGQIQKWSLAAGAGVMGLTTAMDAKARFDGNQAALDYWDKIAQTTPISNDPNVQLVTSFTANPFTPAMKALKGVKIPDSVPVFGGRVMGILPLAKGMGNLMVEPILGKRLYQLFTAEDQAIAYGAKMYNVPLDTMRTYIGPGKAYENIGELQNEILNQGIGVAFRDLSQTDRAVFLKTHPTISLETDQAFMDMYPRQLTKALDNQDGIARLWQEHHWQYADMTGPFNPDTAAMIAKDYRTAHARTYDFRQATNTTLGIPNALAPEASTAIRSALDDVTTPTVTNDWLNEMKASYGGLRKTGQDLITPDMVKANAIPKDVIAQMLDRGDQGYAALARKNPTLVKTGTDPILTPKSSPQEAADALGTTKQVYLDAYASPTAVKDWQGLRDFVTEKYAPPKTMPGVSPGPGYLTAEEVAAKSDGEVWALANNYVADTTAPWLANGARVDAGVRLYNQLQPQLAALKASGGSPARIAALEKQIGQVLGDVQLAKDPVIPFSQQVADLRSATGKGTRDAQLTQAAMRKVDAMQRLDDLAAIDGQLMGMGEAGPKLLDMVNLNREGEWAWSGGAPAVSDKLYAYLDNFVHGDMKQTARMVYEGADKIKLTEAGDAQLWDMIRTFSRDPGSSAQFMKGLTNFEKRAIETRLSNMSVAAQDEVAAGMGKGSGVAADVNVSRASVDPIAELGRLREARDAILDGQTTRQLTRTSALNVPRDYVDSATSDLSSGVVYDPSFLTYTHPRNIMELQSLIQVGATPDAVLQILERDPLLMRGLEKLASQRALETGRPIAIAQYLDDMVTGKSAMGVDPLTALIPKDFVPPVPGVVEVTGPLDQAILDKTPVDHLIGDPGPVPPIEGVPIEQAQKAVGAKRYTNEISKRFDKAGVSIDSPIDPSEWTNRVGEDTLSAINTGVTGHPPLTVGGIFTALREIESGRASALGFGDGVLAEAQSTGRSILDSYLGKVEAHEFPPGIFMQGINPASMGADVAEWARSVVDKGIHLDPNIGLQYGFKHAPKGELVTSIISQPGMADEFMAGYFQPFEQRLVGFQKLKDLRAAFEPKANSEIRAAMQSRFRNAVIEAGGDAGLADAIWTKWSDYHLASRKPVPLETLMGKRYKPGDSAWMADIRNIPNNELNALVVGGDWLKEPSVLDAYFANKGLVPDSLRQTDFDTLFREASSFTRRTLKSSPVLGDQLASLYGGVAHNPVATTLYYMFRFGMDIRFHAMNKMEAMFLYAGRAGLLPDDGPAMFGMTKNAISRNSEEALANTGMPFAGNRHDWTYRTLTKEQSQTLGKVYATLKAEDPELFRRSIEEMAAIDPELSKTIALMGHDPKAYMQEMDNWYGRLMKSPDAEGMIDATMAAASSRTPAMAEVYGRIAEANQNLLTDIRGTFFGNPDRSQVERLMNSYLLYWPISYQIKATKWLMKTLFDRAGGLPTGAGGAYLLNQAMAYHTRLMAEDPGYANTITSNKTLLFAAQMMFPIDPTHPLSWSLSPVVKDVLFGGTKMLADIGPVYTFTHLVPQATTELYKQTSDFPLWDQIYPMLSGRARPKDKAVAPIDTLSEPLDTSRFGQ